MFEDARSNATHHIGFDGLLAVRSEAVGSEEAVSDSPYSPSKANKQPSPPSAIEGRLRSFTAASIRTMRDRTTSSGLEVGSKEILWLLRSMAGPESNTKALVRFV